MTNITPFELCFPAFSSAKVTINGMPACIRCCASPIFSDPPASSEIICFGGNTVRLNSRSQFRGSANFNPRKIKPGFASREIYLVTLCTPVEYSQNVGDSDATDPDQLPLRRAFDLFRIDDALYCHENAMAFEEINKSESETGSKTRDSLRETDVSRSQASATGSTSALSGAAQITSRGSQKFPDALLVKSNVLESFLYEIFWNFGRWLYSSWLKQESFGLNELPKSRSAFFFASNHTSHLDCGAIYVAAWSAGIRNVYALGARDYFFKNPLKAWFVTKFMNVIPFNRKGFSQQELETLLKLLESSSPSNPAAIVIFPEGTRSKNGSLQNFKPGVSFLAEKLNIPVVPVCIKGTAQALPKGAKFPLPHKVTVQFGRPLEMHDYISKSSADTSSPGGAEEAVGRELSADLGNEQVPENSRAVKRQAQKLFTSDLRTAILGMMNNQSTAVEELNPFLALKNPFFLAVGVISLAGVVRSPVMYSSHSILSPGLHFTALLRAKAGIVSSCLVEPFRHRFVAVTMFMLGIVAIVQLLVLLSERNSRS